MSRRLIELIIAVVILGFAVLFGVNYCRGRTERNDAKAEQKTKDALADAHTQKDSAALQTPGVAKADSNLTHQIVKYGDWDAGYGTVKYTDRRVPVVRWLHDTVGFDSSAWVPKPAYVALAADYDSLRTAAVAYRDSSRALLIRYPRIILAQDTAIKYLQFRVDHPRPRRRWGIGGTAGYGVVHSGGAFPSGPGGVVGFTFSF